MVAHLVKMNFRLQILKSGVKEIGTLLSRSSTVDYDTEKYVRDSIAHIKKVLNAGNECIG